MLVLKSVRSKTFLAALSVLVVIAGMLFGAKAASADSVQTQSYQRASQTEACAAQPGETSWQANWGTDSSWKPTWEQWANKGTGGWTCTRSITWARDSAARSYALGDVGPGGGLVFLISGGLRYEMAPNTWSGASDPSLSWCDTLPNDVPSAVGTEVGTGSANTAAMTASVACSSNAAAAVRAYGGGGLMDWFLPSKDELNAMCNYARSPDIVHTGACTMGAQDGTFAAGTYGFATFIGAYYWSSSQSLADYAWIQGFDHGLQYNGGKLTTLQVRPVRAF